MKLRNKIQLFLLLTSVISIAQVGVNNINPFSLLDIRSSNSAAPSITDGILVPKISAFSVTNPGANQNGMMVFLTAPVGLNPIGFYYWDFPSLTWKNVGVASSGSGWSLTGNAGTNPATNFLGTTDDFDLVFKRNNIKSGFLNNFETSFGVNALFNANPLLSNTAVGANSLNQATGASNNNTAVGSNSLLSLTTGNFNTSTGAESMPLLTNGDDNTANGYASMQNIIFGSGNTVFGKSSLVTMNSGNNNTTLGANSLSTMTSGSNNIGIGYNADVPILTGSNQLSIGNSIYGLDMGLVTSKIGIGQTTPTEKLHVEGNVRLSGALMPNNLPGTAGQVLTSAGAGLPPTWAAAGGGGSGWSLTGNAITATDFMGSTNNFDVVFKRNNIRSGSIGAINTAFGNLALNATTTGTNLTAIGNSALNANTGGNYNTAVGNLTLSANTTGGYNTAIGDRALNLNTNGASNTAIGGLVLSRNTTGSNNSAFGLSALEYNTTGGANVALGNLALYGNSTGNSNVSIGLRSMYYSNIGSQNTAIGNFSLNNNFDGLNNTGVGYNALLANNLNNNTALGHSAFSTGFFTNSTALGYNTQVSADNMVRIGNTAVTSIGGQVGWTTVSDGNFKDNIQNNVPGLSFINKLKPVTYTLNTTKLHNYLNKNNTDKTIEIPKTSNTIQTGFIAQEVEKAAKELNYEFSGVDAPKSKDDHYGLRYAEFVVPLVKAVQEQQIMIENLNKQNELLKNQNEILNKKFLELENFIKK